MLGALKISNFAVIDEAEVEFGPGLTVLTGETGAGKSILVDALGLIVGGRAEGDVIRAGAEEATVEAVFARTDALAQRLEDLGLPDDGEDVSIRRVVSRTGRTRAYVNGALVTVGVLGRLMKGLLDISGQHEHVGLFDAGNHRDLLDRFARLLPEVDAYRRALADLKASDARIAELGGDARTARERMEFCRFQIEEVDRLSPQTGEDARLEEERRRLSSSEKLRRLAAEAEALISADGAAQELTGRAVGLLEDAAQVDASVAPVMERLTAAVAELEEAGRGLGRYLAHLEGDPGRLAEVEERLDALKRLCRKHGASLDGVIARRGELAEELSRLENRDGLLAAHLEERAALEAIAWKKAEALHAARVKSAGTFAAAVREALGGLALGKAAFAVKVQPQEALGPHGADEVEFLFSANPGEPPRALAKVASGGEASRLLLAMKRVLAQVDGCGCYVLDEADSGVSGAVAEVVGRMIKDVSEHRQVLCITHLPQVAAYAQSHISIRKQVKGERTTSRVVALGTVEERTRELARMLSGVEVTPEAISAAQALVRSASRVVALRRRAQGKGAGGEGGKQRRVG